MKLVALQETDLLTCVNEAQRERAIVTRGGKPVALIVGIEGLDAEQVELGTNAEFWQFVMERRRQPTLTRQQLEEKISQA